MKVMTNCDCCGKFCETSEMVEIDDEFFCHDCITRCDNCGEYFRMDSEMFEVAKDGIEMLVCWDCYVGNDWDYEDETVGNDWDYEDETEDED